MALDETLLDLVADDPSAAVLRTYEWSRPTLSLGYFQPIAGAMADRRWADVPIVRRPTGGGALWHDVEVTYAAIVPGDHPASRPSRELYRVIHGAIADRLRSLGIPAGRRGGVGGGTDPSQRAFLCFTGRDPEDVISGDVKLIGSAQRRRSGAVLQHGSLLLGRSVMTPELPGLSDLLDISSDPPAWAEILRSIIPAALGLTPRIEDVPASVYLRAKSLAATIYGDRSWTRRR